MGLLHAVKPHLAPQPCCLLPCCSIACFMPLLLTGCLYIMFRSVLHSDPTRQTDQLQNRYFDESCRFRPTTKCRLSHVGPMIATCGSLSNSQNQRAWSSLGYASLIFYARTKYTKVCVKKRSVSDGLTNALPLKRKVR
jgi:hypothetical protein